MRLLAAPSVVVALALARPALAAPVFIKNATATSVTQVLRPWTQTEACSCCVCWETALSTVLAFWDDQPYSGAGPWKLLLPGGNGFAAAAFQKTSNSLYTISALACGTGINTGLEFFDECGPDRDVVSAYTNTQLGYSFSFDENSWVWWGNNVKVPIDAGRPIFYAYYPESNGTVTAGHAVVIVGYEDSTETLFIYKNWQPVDFPEFTKTCKNLQPVFREECGGFSGKIITSSLPC